MEAVNERPMVLFSVSRCALSRRSGVEEAQRPNLGRAMPRWTLDPAVLLKLGEMILEAPVVELCLLGLSVLRNRPCLRICQRLRLRQRRRRLRLARLLPQHDGRMVH